jgi:MerR family Zn(II)-responsive transcriptional regulator of zntA
VYTIGRLALRAQVNADSIRFYERQGLLTAGTRTGSGYHLYTDDALRRIAFIKHAQRCGFTLAEIGELMQMHRGTAAARMRAYKLLAAKRTEILDTIESLHAMSAAVECVLSDGFPDPKHHVETPESPLVLALEAAAGRHMSEKSSAAAACGTAT